MPEEIIIKKVKDSQGNEYPIIDEKCTLDGHYSPVENEEFEITAELSGTEGEYKINTEYTVLTGVKALRDAKGHVTGLTYTAQNIKDTNTDTKCTNVNNHYIPSPNNNSTLVAQLSGTKGEYEIDTEYTVLTGVKALRDAKGHVTGLTYTAQNIKDSDTKNTAGAENSPNSKLYIVGSESQNSYSQTYTNSEIYTHNSILYAPLIDTTKIETSNIQTNNSTILNNTTNFPYCIISDSSMGITTNNAFNKLQSNSYEINLSDLSYAFIASSPSASGTTNFTGNEFDYTVDLKYLFKGQVISIKPSMTTSVDLSGYITQSGGHKVILNREMIVKIYKDGNLQEILYNTDSVNSAISSTTITPSSPNKKITKNYIGSYKYNVPNNGNYSCRIEFEGKLEYHINATSTTILETITDRKVSYAFNNDYDNCITTISNDGVLIKNNGNCMTFCSDGILFRYKNYALLINSNGIKYTKYFSDTSQISNLSWQTLIS